MKQQKPILHARDHMPGGADPLPPCEWIRLNFTGADQTILPGNGLDVCFDEAINTSPQTFNTLDFGTGRTALRVLILRPGVYSASYRIYLDTNPPTPGWITWLNGADEDEWSYYRRFHYAVTDLATANMGHDSYVFRSGPNFGAAPAEIYVTVSNPSTSTGNLVIAATGAGSTGSYLEVVRLGYPDPKPIPPP